MANSDISKIKLPNNDELTIKDGQAVKAIERSGTTFTATRRDGTTFTFTQQDNNNAVTQTISSTDNNEYRVLFSGTADDTTRTEGARKGTNFRYNPSTDNLIIGKINGSALGTAAYKNITDTYSATGTDAVSGKAVKAALDTLPEPMVFKGSLGTGGTITALPVDGSASIGDTYKVITDGTYASKAAKVGDTFICLTKTSSANTWELIPSGDEPSGTVTSVGISNGGGLSVSGSPITSSGTITISHADTSSQASVNNSGRTYIQDITLDTYGHVTGIASATETVVNTDRYVNSAAFAYDSTNDNVKMTLTRAGSDTATVTANIPKVSSSSSGVVPKGATVSSQSQTTKFLREDGTWAAPSYTTNTNTTYTLGTNGNTVTLTPSSGSVQSITVPYATSAGGVAWTNVSSRPTKLSQFTNDITFATSIATSTETNQITLAANTKYAITAGGTSYVFTTPPDTNTWRGIQNNLTSDSTTDSLSAAQGKALANGSARDDTKVAKSGDTMTGNLHISHGASANMTASSTNPKITFSDSDSQPVHLIYTDYDSYRSPAGLKVVGGTSATPAWFEVEGGLYAASGTFTGNVNIQGTNGSWLTTGQSPTVYVKKSSGSGTLGAYGVDTKTGRFVLSTYPSYDDLVYFNWFSDTTLAGTTNTVDKQFTWTPSTNTLSANISGAANKLGSATVGSATKPIYLNGGTATACTYSLNKTVPSDAVFTDTNTHRPIQINGTEILGNNTTALNLKAGSNVLVTNTNGTVTIEATDTNTTYTLSADTINNKIKLTPSSGGTQSITVPYATYASSATTVTRTETNPTQYTTYNLIWNTGSTGLGWNDGLSYATLQGTTSVEGHAYLNVGNNIATGTTGNKTGVIRLYSEAGGYAAIKSNSTITGNVTVNIKTSGTVGAFTSAPTSGQVVITDGTDGGIKTLGYTIAKSVPSDAVFTDHYAWTDITGKPSSFTPASHTHGNIQNGGTLQTSDITIANGDKLVVTDSSDSSKVARTSISFDGSTTTKCLTQKGTWATFGTSNLALGTTASTALKGDTKYAGASTAGGSATSAAKLDTSTAGSATQPCYFANGVPSACTYSLNKTVPSNAVFTDTNNAVTQTATTTSANYELLFSATADNTTRTEGARKTDSLKYNPSTKELTLDGTMILNGYSRSTSTDPCPSIVLKANNIDTDTAVTARTYSNSEINVHDKDGDRLGFVNWFKDADGSIGFAMSAQNKSAGGGNYYNTLEMRVDKTGNRAYSVSDPSAFRTAINTTTCSFTKSISSLAGATIVRRGNVVTLEFGHQITSAGSYTNIGTVSPAPIQTLHFVVNCGSSWQLARINTNGVVSFNNALSVPANAYLIGSCTYITAD